MAAQTQIDSVAEQIALGDAGDRTEMMNDIRQLGQVTATLSSLRIVEDPVVKICERMGRCWISTIGYRFRPNLLCVIGYRFRPNLLCVIVTDLLRSLCKLVLVDL